MVAIGAHGTPFDATTRRAVVPDRDVVALLG
jgi:hypothetical protein